MQFTDFQQFLNYSAKYSYICTIQLLKVTTDLNNSGILQNAERLAIALISIVWSDLAKSLNEMELHLLCKSPALQIKAFIVSVCSKITHWGYKAVDKLKILHGCQQSFKLSAVEKEM